MEGPLGWITIKLNKAEPKPANPPNVTDESKKVDGRKYAVKIANERYRGTTDRTRKLDEVRKHEILLPHPNCVHFYQSWEEDSRLYQQFELCHMSLAQLSEQKHDIAERTVWAYLVDLLHALQG